MSKKPILPLQSVPTIEEEVFPADQPKTEQDRTYNIELERTTIETRLVQITKGEGDYHDLKSAMEHALTLANSNPGLSGWRTRPTTAKIAGVTPQPAPVAEVVSVRTGGKTVYLRPSKF